MPKKIEILNKQFGDLKVIAMDNKRSTHKKKYYMCECLVCNRKISKRKDAIMNHIGVRHQDCVHAIEEEVDMRFKHAWENMRARTSNPNFHQYKDYGAKGIESDEFVYFIDFYDALYKSYIESVKLYGEKETTLDRIDSTKSYTTNNLRWTSHKKQNENLTTTFRVFATNKNNADDVMIFESLKDAGRYFNIHHNLIKQRALFPNKRMKRNLGYNFRIERKY